MIQTDSTHDCPRGWRTPLSWLRRRVPRSWRRERPTSCDVIWAVCRQWRVDRTHEYVSARTSRGPALRAMARDAAYWRRGPIRPELSVVRISRHEFRLHGRHRPSCTSPDCPGMRFPTGSRSDA